MVGPSKSLIKLSQMAQRFTKEIYFLQPAATVVSTSDIYKIVPYRGWRQVGNVFQALKNNLSFSPVRKGHAPLGILKLSFGNCLFVTIYS